MHLNRGSEKRWFFVSFVASTEVSATLGLPRKAVCGTFHVQVKELSGGIIFDFLHSQVINSKHKVTILPGNVPLGK